MNPFHVLELEDGADEREVKRAYARLLRLHRPGDDPVGFQRIHEAYQACLNILRWQAEHAGEYDDDEAVAIDHPAPVEKAATTPPPALPSDINAPVVQAVVPHLPAFNLDAVLDELVAAARDPSIDLEAWLSRHPDLYSIDNKTQIADALVWHLHRVDPLPPPRLKVLLHLFELDSVNQRFLRQEHAIEQLRRNSAQAHGDPDWSFMLDSQQRLTSSRQKPQNDGFSWRWIFWAIIILGNIIRMAAS